MNTDLSKVIANHLPIDYSGFLCLESNMNDTEAKPKNKTVRRSQKLKTCETATQATCPSDSSAAKQGEGKQDRLMGCRSGENRRRGRSIRNPED